MTAEIVNLRQARKARERVAREKEAEANRAKFGRSKVERRRQDAEETLADKRLDGLKRTPQEHPDGGGPGKDDGGEAT